MTSRTREEIKKAMMMFPESPAVLAGLQLEILLDIRDLLAAGSKE